MLIHSRMLLRKVWRFVLAMPNKVARQRALLSAALIFSALVYLFAWSPVLTVRAIEVNGLPQGVSQQSIVSKSGIFLGEKMARVEPRAVSRAFADYSWIADLDISRHWISGKVSLDFTSLTPVGVFEGKAIAADGTLFIYPGTLPTRLPQVSAANAEIGLSAIALFKQLPQDLQSSMVAMTARNDSSITSIHKNGHKNGAGAELRIIWGSNAEMALKVDVLRALLALPENKKVVRVDLSAPHAPIVK